MGGNSRPGFVTSASRSRALVGMGRIVYLSKRVRIPGQKEGSASMRLSHRNIVQRMREALAPSPAADPPLSPSQPPRPSQPVYVVGDLHGCVDLFNRLLDRIEADIARLGLGDAILVTVGDTIDRGTEAPRVLDLLFAMSRDFPAQIVALKGNHEKMMLDFLDRPDERGPRWLRHGGLQTLGSYRVQGLTETTQGVDLIVAANTLRARMTPGLESWLRDWPLFWQSGTLGVVHAGADPARPLTDQDDRTLIWGHPDFDRLARPDALWIAHGHFVVPEPLVTGGRIAVDTGAYATGRLSAARILPDGDVSFLSATV